MRFFFGTLFLLWGIVEGQAQTPDPLVFDLNQPMQLLATLFDAKQLRQEGEALWKPSNYAERLDSRVSDDGFYHTRLDTLLYFKKGGIERAVAVFSTLRYDKGAISDCHGCGAAVSAATLVRTTRGDWYVETFSKHFTSLGSFGESGTAGLFQFGPEMWCLSLSMDWWSQGVFSAATSFYGVEDLQRVYHFIEHQDNAGDEPVPEIQQYSYDKSIHFLSALETNTGWWDIEIVTRGSELDPDLQRSVTANRVERFSLDLETGAYMRVCR
jgi:hypothetical protein